MNQAVYSKETLFSLKECQDIIENELEQLNFFTDKEPDLLYKPVRYILSIGGKRVRPSLVLLACNIFNNSLVSALKPALAIELFHNFTLLHDDIMDRSPLRRGNPTVHKVWNENVGILSGDAMSILAYDLLVETDIDYLKTVLQIFNKLAIEVCEGQQYDMDFETMEKVSIENYLKMIELKTSVLIAGSLQIGAIVGGASESDANNLFEFGRNIGLAFQIQDDYLDVYGDPDKFQKFIGGDIVANKQTILMLRAKELASAEQIDLLNSVPVDPDLADLQKVKLVRDIYNSLDINNYSQDLIKTYFDSATYFLSKVAVAENRKSELKEFTNQLFHRKY